MAVINCEAAITPREIR
jgi:hypothetical protein